MVFCRYLSWGKVINHKLFSSVFALIFHYEIQIKFGKKLENMRLKKWLLLTIAAHYNLCTSFESNNARIFLFFFISLFTCKYIFKSNSFPLWILSSQTSDLTFFFVNLKLFFLGSTKTRIITKKQLGSLFSRFLNYFFIFFF